jgi:hypothetical protein
LIRQTFFKFKKTLIRSNSIVLQKTETLLTLQRGQDPTSPRELQELGPISI